MVLDAELPALKIPHTEWFHCDCLAQYYDVEVFSEAHWTIIENFVRHAVRRGCNMLLTPVFTPPLDNAVNGERPTVQLVDVSVNENGYTFGYDRFERWVDMCKRCGIRYYEISHLFSQWGAIAAPKIIGKAEGAVDEPVCANDHIEPFLKNRPSRLWTYYCTGQHLDVSNRFIALPGFRTRILGAQLYKYAIDGFLHWGYNFYNSEFSLYPIDPYRCTDADGAFPSGDPFLVYPEKDGKPVDSIRSMLMEKAMEDLRAMHFLESLTDRETVMKCLMEEENGELTFRDFPQRAGYLVEVREKVNAAIMAAL